MSKDQRGTAAVGRAVAVLLLFALAPGTWGQAPLNTADLVRFLQAGLSERSILAELRDRGFAEPLDPAREADLREAGASETLIVAVRRAAPAEKADPPPPAERVLTRGRGQEPTFATATRTVRVPVSVLDKGGQPVLGLREADFEVSEDGKRQEVTLFSGERRPLRIALALDVSGSMDNKVRQVELALKHFIDLLEPRDEILVITFNSEVRVVQDFTSDREQLGSVLNELQPAGSTALFDAAYEAIRRVAEGPAESKAVVLVSDGVDTASSTSFEALRELARRSEVPVFSIGLNSGSALRNLLPNFPSLPVPRPRGPGRGWPPRGGWPGGGGTDPWPGGGGRGGGPAGKPDGFDARPLLDLAEETGGRAEILKGIERYTPGIPTPGAARLKEAVESIAMTLRHRYLLGYEPPDGKLGWRRIRIEVGRPATTARARKGYYAG
jgi:VWFA-related protein